MFHAIKLDSRSIKFSWYQTQNKPALPVIIEAPTHYIHDFHPQLCRFLENQLKYLLIVNPISGRGHGEKSIP
jgi:hypothetical protein